MMLTLGFILSLQFAIQAFRVGGTTRRVWTYSTHVHTHICMCVLAHRNADRQKEFTTLDDFWCMRDTIGNGLPAAGLWHSVHRRRKLADRSQGAVTRGRARGPAPAYTARSVKLHMKHSNQLISNASLVFEESMGLAWITRLSSEFVYPHKEKGLYPPPRASVRFTNERRPASRAPLLQVRPQHSRAPHCPSGTLGPWALPRVMLSANHKLCTHGR